MSTLFWRYCKGVPAEQHQVRHDLFHTIDCILRPNNRRDTSRQDPNSTKKLLRGDTAWTTHKHLLVWLVDTLQNHISLPDSRLQKVLSALAEFLPNLCQTSRRRWVRLVRILRVVTPALPGGRTIFGHLQRTLGQPVDCIRLMCSSFNELVECRSLISDLGSHPTHLLEVVPPYPTWYGTHDACQWSLGGLSGARKNTRPCGACASPPTS